MSDRLLSRSRILVAGNLPPDCLRALGRPPQTSGANISALGGEALRAELLILGDGLPDADLPAIVAALSESAPGLRIIRIREASEAREVSSLPDIPVFTWPNDSDGVRRAVQKTARRIRSGLHREGWIVGSASVVVGLFLWGLVTQLHLLPPYLLPSPLAVLQTIIETPADFAYHTAITGLEALVGFFLGNLLALGTGVLLFRSKHVHDLSMPVLLGLQAIPILALAPLLSVWLGTGLSSKIVMAVIVCYFPVLANLLAAFRAVDRDLAELFVFHRATYRQTLMQLLIPASYPALQAGLRISGGLAVVGAIVAEFTGSLRGLGYVLLNATYRFETDRLFAGILLSMLLGIVFANLGRLLQFFIPTARRSSIKLAAVR